MITVAQLDAVPERIREKIAFGPGCWQWLAGHDDDGYGRVWFNNRTRSAHRLLYALLIGPIPDGITLDHECLNKGCVNPDHMGFMTRAEAGHQGSVVASANTLARTHCKHGHLWTEENTIYPTGGGRQGRRRCRTCVRNNAARRYPEWSQQKRLQKEAARNADPNYVPFSSAKLTEQNVREIRIMHTAGYAQTVIAETFNVSKSTIHALIHGITWSSVDSTATNESTNVRCLTTCWYASSDICNCPCNGKNHGIGHPPFAT